MNLKTIIITLSKFSNPFSVNDILNSKQENKFIKFSLPHSKASANPSSTSKEHREFSPSCPSRNVK